MKNKELEEKTVSELRTVAKKAGIALKTTRKAEIIDEIIKSVKKAKASKPKTKPKPKAKIATKKVLKPKVKAKPKKTVKLKAVKPVKPKKAVKPKVVPAKPKKPVKPKVIPVKPLPPMPPKPVPIPKKPAPKIAKPKPAPPRVFPALPISNFSTEYSMDTVIALTLEPKKVFIYWEVTENTLKRLDGELILRVYDVTGIADPAKSISSFDISIQRIGSVYIEVMPEREFIMETGILKQRVFRRISRSNRVSTPLVTPLIEGATVLPERYYEVTPGGLGS